MTKTRRGIYYDLSQSPYQFRSNSVTYHFSSSLNLKRFADRLEGRRTTIMTYLTKLFGFEIKADHLAEVHLYLKVEKRGFLISRETPRGMEIICHQTDLSLSGGTPMKKN